MVFLTTVNCMRRCLGNRGPDRFWNRRRTFSLSGHLYGRHRNVYKFALRGVLKLLSRSSIGRSYKKSDMKELHELRISSAAHEHGLSRYSFVENIQRCLILLNRKSLANLAIWEPRTFKALTDVAKAKMLTDGGPLSYRGMKNSDVSYFVRRDLLKDEK